MRFAGFFSRPARETRREAPRNYDIQRNHRQRKSEHGQHPVLLLRYEPAVLPESGAEHWAWERQFGLKYSLAGSGAGAFAGSGAGAR